MLGKAKVPEPAVPEALRRADSLHHNSSIQLHPVFVHTTETIGAFLHIDRHLVVEARLP